MQGFVRIKQKSGEILFINPHSIQIVSLYKEKRDLKPFIVSISILSAKSAFMELKYDFQTDEERDMFLVDTGLLRLFFKAQSEPKNML